MNRRKFMPVMLATLMVFASCDFVGDVFADINAPYAVGDVGPGGGYIFYDKGDYTGGWRYMEVAPAATEWELKLWSSTPGVVGGTGAAVGTGTANTQFIADWLLANKSAEGNFYNGRAAYLCYDIVYGGYDDWFLPSIDELTLMYVNLKLKGLGGFGAWYYWSSTEASSSQAWDLNFVDNFQAPTSSSKDLQRRVRAVRIF